VMLIKVVIEINIEKGNDATGDSHTQTQHIYRKKKLISR
jgi:hypothetical protein